MTFQVNDNMRFSIKSRFILTIIDILLSQV